MTRTPSEQLRPPDPVDLGELAGILSERYALEGAFHPLPGDRDTNFLLRTSERAFVVKVSAPEEADDVLAFESTLMAWLSQAEGVPVPRIVPARGGAPVLAESDGRGSRRRIRVLQHLPGRTWAQTRPRTREMRLSLGGATASLALRLATFSEACPAREGFLWSLSEAGTVMARGLEDIAAPDQKALIEGCLRNYEGVAEKLASLPTQILHGDLNDHNVLVAEGCVTGILDFGDAHVGPALYDLAIAIAYAILDEADPITAAADVVEGYHAVRPLSEEEVDALFPLVRARLGASVSISARRRAATTGGDAYHFVSERPAWEALASTATVHPRLARGFLRAACGLPPCPRSPQVVAWIERQRSIASVMDVPKGRDGREAVVVVDLSVGSPVLTGRDTDDSDAFTRRTFDAIHGAGAAIGLGRYLEPRGFYLTETFSGRTAEMPERRTVHMGIDVFDEPGAPVRAPLGGVVRSVRDNKGRLDYGPTVILEHETDTGPFWTLYGHLERASVSKLEEGASIAGGEQIARVGPRPENGDWPPHLHFQIMTDLLDYEGDFPGVSAPREAHVWKSFLPDPNLLLGFEAETTYRPPDDLREARSRLLGPSLSLAYDDPIHVVRGLGSYLYDVWGREYLDCVNNVAHVGHEHPRVVDAGRSQMAVLNTNTRYLHERVLAYADRLGRTLPDPLSVCFFVNSGSEANELALRIARTCTGRRGVVVLEGGYHGHTSALVELSHYKFSGPGGDGPAPWVRAALMPDDYRGPHRRDDPERASAYAEDVARALEDLAGADHPPAAFLCEAILSCGGQIEPPPGYLAAAYAHARAAGALCIADEVQTGFGRVGSHMWGFETQDVIPDIVTLGKPIGNGHPLGAVVTTPEIAARFANGMEFFSTFGGNPVSSAIGLAVLDVLEDEDLQANAHDVGAYLKRGLEDAAERYHRIGDVRGRGLFLGVEFVRDRDGRTPDRDAARYVVERMKEKGVLLSTDGPDGNVVKIKPPMTFSRDDADRLLHGLDEVLGESPLSAEA